MYRILLVFFLSGIACTSQGAVIATYGQQFGSGGSFATPYLDYEIRSFDQSLKLFDALVVDFSNVGDTFIADRSNESSFIYFEDLFTNGIEDSIWVMRLASPFPSGGGSGGGSLISETVLFAELPAIDLDMYLLESVQLTIDDITHYTNYVSPFSPTRVFNHWTNSHITVSFHGKSVVPIGATVYMVCIGLFALLITSQGSKNASRRNRLTATPA